MTKNNKLIDINKYYINLNEKNKLYLFSLIIICLIILLFKNLLNIQIERILLFIIIFSLIISITKNWLITIITTFILFLLINLFINTHFIPNYIESFDNSDSNNNSNNNDLNSKKEDLKNKLNSSDFINDLTLKMQDYSNNKDMQSAAEGLQKLLQQLDGGIDLKEKDKKETDKLNVNTDDFKDEQKFDPMKKAQQDTYELINMVDSLKNTMETLAPVLTQGKEIMNMFENLKM